MSVILLFAIYLIELVSIFGLTNCTQLAISGVKQPLTFTVTSKSNPMLHVLDRTEIVSKNYKIQHFISAHFIFIKLCKNFKNYLNPTKLSTLTMRVKRMI